MTSAPRLASPSATHPRGPLSAPLPANLAVTLALCLGLAAQPAAALSGRVIDGTSGQPITEATVTQGTQVVRSDSAGRYTLPDGLTGPVGARAPGYRQARVDASTTAGAAATAPDLKLAPFRPKALYLSFWGVGDRGLRHAAEDLAASTEINALVIDLKGDRGLVPFPTRVALADQVGARQTTTVRNLPELIAHFKEQGLYLIARIVTFKDDPLAHAHPERAVKTASGALFKDLEGLSWMDPSRPENWQYPLDLAAEAAELGFDEIQFDYVRFPDTPGLVFSIPNTEEQRVTAINGFLAAARKRLAPYNVFLAADIFGYVFWNQNDTFIGQKLEDLAQHLDYLCPMLYPSGFKFGIPGYTNPVAHPQEIVYLTLAKGGKRSGISPLRFRPWLQAFRDYAFDHRPFEATEIRQQIDAAEKFGSNGWMLWNPRNAYSNAGLKSQ